MKRILFAGLATACLALPVTAQQRPDTILVLDASGSMWGQIDGVNKITIARDVVADFVSVFPNDENLGLVAYGHRERGQCSDIETIVTPARGTGEDIAKIVAELNPRGMTPMTDAVIAAAQALRHTEQAATVILISDGIETCNPDPCAAARALNEAGVDFTAHVIGFDVRGEAEALLQMQCIAAETGGRFFTADNANELRDALEQVAAPVAAPFTFTAHQSAEPIGPEPVFFYPGDPVNNPLVEGDVFWRISDNEHSFEVEAHGNPFTTELPFGDYVVTVTADVWDQPVQEENTFAPDSINMHVMFPPPPPALAELTLRAVMDSENGPLIDTPITWEFSRDGDSFEFDGNPGVQEVRDGEWSVTGYHTALEISQTQTFDLAAGENKAATFVFETPLPKVILTAPESVPAVSQIPVSWDGIEAHPHHSVEIYNPATGKAFDSSLTRDKFQTTLSAPVTPGTYELRYIAARKVIGTKAIEVTPINVVLHAPDSAPVASRLTVSWEGIGPAPYHQIVLVDASGKRVTDAHTRDSFETTLQLPETHGAYELHYVAKREVVARKPLEITDLTLEIIAPETAPAASYLEVSWSGPPKAQNDLVRIRHPGQGGALHEARTQNGDKVTLRMPATPGTYELTYEQKLGVPIITKLIEVTPVDIRLIAPPEVSVEAEFEVSWTGIPPANYDLVWLGAPEGGSRLSETYTRQKDVVRLKAPKTPGTYELRYYQGNLSNVIARLPLTVIPEN